MSEEQDDSQKTEEPTTKKLEETRKKGQVALSREMNHWVMILAATILIGAVGGSVLGDLKDHLKIYIEQAHAFPSVPGGLMVALTASFWEIVGIMTLPFLALLFAAFISPFVQVGALFAPQVIKPDLSKISPMKGLKRLFSMRSIMEFVKGILKLILIGGVAALLIMPYMGQIEHLVGAPMSVMMDEFMEIFIRMMTGILVVLLVIAVIDISFQRKAHYKKLRMTKQEVKDEHKQSEGDPHVKGRLRQLRAERARQRMMAAVPTADVVITNPTHYSIALKYDTDQMEAPVCVAKGVDDVALRIRELAKESGVTVYEAPPLARAMYDVIEIDEMIPMEHYKAVAEIISYVFRLKGKIQ
jgi:flagellar biosynthetic protein FlhB